MDCLSFFDVEPSLLKTEERIIVAAIKIFAEYPLHAVTVRMIAKEARVCFSSISRTARFVATQYFSSVGNTCTFHSSRIQ